MTMRKILTLLISGGILAVVFLLAAGSPQQVNAQVQPTVPAVGPTIPAEQTIPFFNPAGPSLQVNVQANSLDAFSQRVLYLTNAQRTRRGLKPLRINANLENAANWFAQDMASRQVKTLSHIDSKGRDPGQRLRAFGYPWSWYGENIAMGYATPAAVVNAWMNSPGHRANILNPHFTEIGIGHASGGGAIYWVQDFGRR